MPTLSTTRRCAAPVAALVALAAAAGIVPGTGAPDAAAQGRGTEGVYQAPIGDTLPAAEMLTEQSRDGWELVQIVHHAPGMQVIGKNQIVMYLRQRADGDSRSHEYHVAVRDSLPSPRELVEHAMAGWELVQIVHHAPGMRNIGPNQLAMYLRRPAGGQ